MDKVKADQVLDDDALSLFQEIGGLDETNRLTPLGEIKEDDSDDWKLLFVEFAELLASQLCDYRTDAPGDKGAPEIEGSAIDAILEKLDTMTGFAGKQKTLLLRNRGMVFSAEPQAEKAIRLRTFLRQAGRRPARDQRDRGKKARKVRRPACKTEQSSSRHFPCWKSTPCKSSWDSGRKGTGPLQRPACTRSCLNSTRRPALRPFPWSSTKRAGRTRT